MARTMKFRNRLRSSSTFELNLTPLLDVVLQLITFFMMLIHFGTKIEGASAAIRLPTTPAALPGGELGLDRLVVGVDARGRLLADGEALDASASTPWWGEQARKRRAGQATLNARDRFAPTGDEPAIPIELPTLVVVRADKEVSFGTVRGLLAAAQEAGFARFSLIVMRGATP